MVGDFGDITLGLQEMASDYRKWKGLRNIAWDYRRWQGIPGDAGDFTK